MKQLHIRSFGSFQVMLDDLPCSHSLKTEKSRALFLYLLIEHDRPHRRARLVDLLWPAFPGQSAHHSLRQSLYHIRSFCTALNFARFELSTSTSDVQLLPGSDFHFDVFEFSQQLVRCEMHHQPGVPLCGPCLDILISAVNIYRGEFMDGFSLRDAPQFDWWLYNKRESYHQQALKALAWITHTLLWNKDYEHAIRNAQREVEVAPWSEPAHQRYMKALALAGERSRALKQFEICKHVLFSEIGTKPSNETICLYKMIHDDTFDHSVLVLEFSLPD